MMSRGGLSRARLGRMHETLMGHVQRGEVPGLVSLVSRRGATRVDAIGTKAFGGGEPMRRDTLFRIASMTKPITAAAAMILVEECRLRLDDPVDGLLPELANRRVLRAIGSPLDDTVPAQRAITLRDLLTFRMGLGLLFSPPGQFPIQDAMDALGRPGLPWLPDVPPDAWMARVGALPLMRQPGEAWLYHTAFDVLGVLIARATGQTLGDFLRERIFEPLGMKDTGFHVPAKKLSRLPPAYRRDPDTGKLEVFDALEGQWSRPPVFEAGGGGLVSTVDDYLAFCQMMLDKGVHGRERILSRPSVELMTMDHLTPEQRAEVGVFFKDSRGWGFGVSVVIRRDDLSATPGRFGWDGGFGTSAHSDPAERLIGILMTQRLLESPQWPPVYQDFWTSAYQAIDD